MMQMMTINAMSVADGADNADADGYDWSQVEKMIMLMMMIGPRWGREGSETVDGCGAT